MNDIINITVEETDATVNILVEETTEDVSIDVSEITEQIEVIVEDVGIKGRDGLNFAEAQDIRDRLTALENFRIDELPNLC